MNAVAEKAQVLQMPAAEQAALPMVATSSASLILDSASMDAIMRLADIMAKGRSTIPDHLKGNSADCAAVVMQAMQWQMNPFAVAQKTHLVNGTLGYEGQLVNAAIQSSKVTVDRFAYEWFGPWEKIIGKTKVCEAPAKGKYGDKDYKKAYQYRVPDYQMQDEEGLGVRISATLRGESQPRELELLLVQASVRNSPLWATDPKQQLAYLAVKRWSRLYAPDVILGVYTPDELEEVNREMRDITPAPAASPRDVGELPECSAEKFESNRAAWRDLIISKKKTVSGLIAMLSTKATLTEDQKLTIDSWSHENE
ncbi:RecT family recombinase [Rugamonas sp.]|uniref:RecT family recombinase n=1 Tax=Rugamonas sp. TaxID=1926287 RepID=UPI0025EC727A|nr:RecT family recombinase [Rugamonas sp.]